MLSHKALMPCRFTENRSPYCYLENPIDQPLWFLPHSTTKQPRKADVSVFPLPGLTCKSNVY